MIDMHCHTTCSDGSEGPIDILKIAEEKNLEYISITDHNTCKSYEMLEEVDIKKYYSGKLVRGVELNAIIDGYGIELLGYGIDYKIINEKASQMYYTKKQKNEFELKQLCNICKRIKANVSEKLYEEYNPEEYIYASEYVHKNLTQNEENKRLFMSDEAWKDPNKFYRKEMSDKRSLFYIDSSLIIPKIEDVIKLIKEANGLVFVPHIYIYGDRSEIIFNKLKEKYLKYIDGFECFYPRFSKEQTEHMQDFCKENNLYMSGGSDYHGKIKPDISLGTGINNNLNIKADVIKKWLKEKYIFKEV